jgi:phenylacetate-CoA ligase
MRSLRLAVRSFVTTRLREGRRFRRLLAELESHERWDRAAIERYHEAALARVFRWCEQTPYYADRINVWRAGARSAREALDRMPLLDKETLRTRNAEFRRRGWSARFVHAGYTSGTTGSPITCWRDSAAITFENAALWRLFRWAGVELADRRAILRGDLVVPAARREPPFWVRASRTTLLLSSYHLAPQFFGAYVDALRRFDPAAVQAYPSSIALLAAWLVERGETLPLKAVITSSETLLDTQRELIERAFRCPVIDYYGNAERTALLSRCERGAYHVMWDYAVTEFVPDETGEPEIVGTPLMNRAMPLLRYRTGDGVEISAGRDRCPCGRTFPVCGRPLGRRDVYIVTPDGRRIGRLDHVFKGLHHIREAQIVQTALDRVVVRVVPDAAFGEHDETLLLAQTGERLGPDVRVNIERVESIPRGPRGKFAAVVSELRGAPQTSPTFTGPA